MDKAATAAGVSFFTDASLFVQVNHKAPTLLFGPGEPELCHQANESVELKQYEQYIEILMEAALRAASVENEPNPAKIDWKC